MYILSSTFMGDIYSNNFDNTYKNNIFLIYLRGRLFNGPVLAGFFLLKN